MNIIRKVEASENETDRIRTGLHEPKIMKIDTKKCWKIGSQLRSLKGTERMARFIIEEIIELLIKSKKLESELKLEPKLVKLIFKMLGLNCENE